MKYLDLGPIVEAYSRGENITSLLRECLGVSVNTQEIIEIAYDLQAGTYTEHVDADLPAWKARCDEVADISSHYRRCGRVDAY